MVQSYSPGGANVPSHEGTLADLCLQSHMSVDWKIVYRRYWTCVHNLCFSQSRVIMPRNDTQLWHRQLTQKLHADTAIIRYHSPDVSLTTDNSVPPMRAHWRHLANTIELMLFSVTLVHIQNGKSIGSSVFHSSQQKVPIPYMYINTSVKIFRDSLKHKH